jgi:plastocyanin
VRTSTQRFALALVCAGALLPSVAVFAAGAATDASAGKPATHRVVIDGLKYEPETLTVRRGDTIVWTNKDPFPHTVTAPGKFDSHDIAADGSWKYVARSAREYAYICTLHPTMKGTLRVE